MTVRHETSRALFVLAAWALAAPARADQLLVPAQHATIQQAIAAASSGDTILVAPGTYGETLDYLGKQLVVQGEGGAAVTTLDAAGAGTAVVVNGAEPAGTALRGFTVTGGAAGQLVVIAEVFGGYGGGGVFVGQAAHLELTDCVITGNALDGAQPTYGGALAANGGTVTLTGCTLSDNVARIGGAISNMSGGSSFSLIGCTISGNTATAPGLGGPGAAIHLTGGLFAASQCLIADNTGTGLARTSNGTTLSECVFTGNTGWGYVAYHPDEPRVAGASFLGNGLGGARLLQGAVTATDTHAERCVFANGDTLQVSTGAGGLHRITNCSFDGAGVLASKGITIVTNTIFRNVSPAVAGTPDSLTFIHCNVEGGAPGEGNIDADPLWLNPPAGDYQLAPGSPCIDAGYPGSPADPDLTTVEMGALPFAPWTSVGLGLVDFYGWPDLAGQGTLASGQTVGLGLVHATPFAPVVLILGLSQFGAAFKGGVLWPAPDVIVAGLVSDADGRMTVAATLPVGLPSGFSLWAQAWYVDASGPHGFAWSDAVTETAP